MKKIFRAMLAAAVIFGAASCAKENVSPATVGQEVDVTFTADLGGALGSRAIADGTTVDEVAWAIYENGSATPLESLQGTLVLTNKQATLNVRLVTGKTYDLAFFAYKAKEAKETLKDVTAVDPLHYSVLWNEKSVELNIDSKDANDESLDCFWYVEHALKIEGPVSKTFTLTRPLAQLNIGVTASDIAAAAVAGYSVKDSELSVDTYTKFNLFDGSLSNPQPTFVTFKRATSPVNAADVLAIQNDATEYKYLATTYLLVNEKTTSDVVVSLWDQNGDAINTLEYSFVPFQRNYRTNILGNLLTNPAVFTIIVDEDFNEPDNIVKHWDGTMQTVTPDAEGNYSVANAAELAYIANLVNTGNTLAGKTVTLTGNVDLNGHNWIPIGYWETFEGTLDGAGYSISNLVHESTDLDCYIGLFGCTNNATIKNLTVKNIYIKVLGDDSWAGGQCGGIIGFPNGNTVLENVNVLGTVQIEAAPENLGGQRVGAVIGGDSNKSKSLVLNNVTVNVTEDSYVKGYLYVGGVIGAPYSKVTLTNVTSNIDVYSTNGMVGGIIGLSQVNSTLTNCSSSGDVYRVVTAASATENQWMRIGGIIGCWANASGTTTLDGCSYTGTLHCKDNAGNDVTNFENNGLVGRGYTTTSPKGVLVIK